MNPSETNATSMDEALQTTDWICADSSRFRWFSDLMLVTKARANVAVVCTTFVGFSLHAEFRGNWLVLLCALVGTGLLAGSAAIANQIIEREFDRNMARTRNRPIAAGRLRPRTAFWLCAASVITGVRWLWMTVNSLAAIFAIFAFLIYVFAYTPLKRRSPACVWVGAVSGALPIWVGWAASGADFGFWSAVAFALLFLWQVPHFGAIAWWRRTDYLGAGYRILNPQDYYGYRTASWSLLFTFAAFAVSVLPALAHRVNEWYWPGATGLGLMFSFFAIRFFLRRSEAAARALFIASLYYLPAVYGLMLLCKIAG